ncbi:alpha-glucan water dikinase, chloroplastic isoform X4 [Canna indica]|uniref:Alpha-glucan water dikinase, chloroplastic isoform X4 n=1 Tax=Canna indica TaxID=4628 RepID=A0AAQ3L7H3_9LILI|nr:alpha-glucan water dikinase, chloroplastic isoform X4 [Canna indica]
MYRNMSNSVGHTLPQQALFRSSVLEKQSKAHQGVSAIFFCGVPSTSKAENAASHSQLPLLSTRFLGKKFTARKGNPFEQNLRTVTMISRAVLATDPASELGRKFKLDTNSELEINVRCPKSGSLIQIEFQVTNNNGSLVLHWGAIRHKKKDWSLPSRRPDGTKVYKNRALRTPFTKSDSTSLLSIEIDDPEIQAVEFLILDEAENKWFKNNGQNFQVILEQGSQDPRLDSVSPVTVPEDLVQIQAYLRWERKGRQTYTPDQEKASVSYFVNGNKLIWLKTLTLVICI